MCAINIKYRYRTTAFLGPNFSTWKSTNFPDHGACSNAHVDHLSWVTGIWNYFRHSKHELLVVSGLNATSCRKKSCVYIFKDRALQTSHRGAPYDENTFKRTFFTLDLSLNDVA